MEMIKKVIDLSFESKELKIKKIVSAYCDYLFTVQGELYLPYVVEKQRKTVMLEPLEEWCKTSNDLFFELMNNNCYLTITDRKIIVEYEYFDIDFKRNITKVLQIILIKNNELYY